MRPQLPEMVRALLEPKAYPDNPQRIGDDFKELYPNLHIVRLIVDTRHDLPEDVYYWDGKEIDRVTG